MLGAIRRAVMPGLGLLVSSRVVILPLTVVRLLRIIGLLGPQSKLAGHENVRGGYGRQILAPQRCATLLTHPLGLSQGARSCVLRIERA